MEFLTAFKELSFSQPAYFLLVRLLALITAIFAGAILFKLFLRPKKTVFSRYQLLGRDAKWLTVLFLCLFCIIALAGPRLKRGYTLNTSGNLDIIWLIDHTFSMKSNDIKPSRQETAKNIALDFVDGGIARSGDRVSLFVFGGVSHWRMPVSEDWDDFRVKLGEIKHPNIYEDESQLDTDIALAIEHVSECMDKQDRFWQKSSAALNLVQTANHRIVFLLSDGDDKVGADLVRGIKELKKRNIRVYSIGIGTRAGQKMSVKAYDSDDPKKIKEIATTTALKMEKLEKIALETGGKSLVLDSAYNYSIKRFIESAIDENRNLVPALVPSNEYQDVWWEVLSASAMILLVLTIKFG